MRVALIALGALGMAYAVVGGLADPDVAAPGVLIFLAASLLLHDLVWMPVVLLAGAAVVRFVPARRRPAARTTLIAAASLGAVALPQGRVLGWILIVAAVAAAHALRRKKSESSARAGAG